MAIGKREGLLLTVILVLFLLISCTSMESQFKKAKAEDTIVAYKNFLWKYPKGEYSEIAKKRIAEIQREEECKRSLSKLKAVGYDGYSCKAEYDSSLPIKTDCVSIKITGKVKRSVKFIGGYVGSIDLSSEEQQEVNNFFEKSLYSSFSQDFKIQEDCICQLVVVCGEGGGIKLGYGQLLMGKLFFLDNKLKKLIYFAEVEGVGKEVTGALSNLASSIKKNLSSIVAPATSIQTILQETGAPQASARTEGEQRGVPPDKLSQEQTQPKEASNDAGIISITSDPPGAKIFIDGEFKGQTPAEISLNTGMHQLFLQLQPYEPYKESISIEKGQTKTLNIKLAQGEELK